MVAVTTWLAVVAGPVQRVTTGVVTGRDGCRCTPVSGLTSSALPVSAPSVGYCAK